jgi:uncharacterized protein with GYD domain
MRIDVSRPGGMVQMPTYINLVKFRKKPSREIIKANLESMEKEKKQGIQYRGIYWTLGRYDAIVILDAPDEKAMMRSAISRSDWMSSETMVALPAEEARKLVE